jgi:hypothetical protein
MTDRTQRPATQRSRVTNGKLLASDGRSLWARRYRDLIEGHLADMGGLDAVSVAEQSLVKRAATLEVELEQLESRFAEMQPADAAQLDLYQRMTNTLRRTLETIGLQRRAKDVTPDLRTYLTQSRQTGQN